MIACATLSRKTACELPVSEGVVRYSAVMAANSPKFTGAVPAKADELLEQLVVYGTPAEARERMTHWLAAGADLGVVFLRANLSPEEIDYTLNAFCPMLS